MGQGCLNFLKDFFHQMLDLRSAENNLKLKLMSKELPVLWPNLVDIFNLESSVYLPQDVANIILKLIFSRLTPLRCP